MTRKDYIKFAETFKTCHERLAEAKGVTAERKITAEGMLRAIERDIADLLLADNPRFDYGKFMAYIGH
jgi:hypothetical protein